MRLKSVLSMRAWRVFTQLGLAAAGPSAVAADAAPSRSVEATQAICPQGADHVATLPEMRGASAVAFVGERLLVATPESLAGGALGPAVVSTNPLEPDAAALPLALEGAAAVAWASDLAVADDGTVAIADLGGGVVLRDTSGGARVVAQELLRRPTGLGWAGEHLAVSDALLKAVLLVDRDGREVERIGAGLFVEPAGLAVDPRGTLWIADRLASCLWRVDRGADGGYTRATPRAVGERGAGPGQFSAPRDVAVLPRGDAWCLLVADELNHRIQSLTSEGAAAGFFGMHALIPRQGEGRIHYPVSLAVAPDGAHIAVAEAFEDRVQILRLKDEPDELDPSLGAITSISSHFGSESSGGGGLLIVVDVESQGVAIMDARRTPPLHIAIVGGSGALPGRFGEVAALALDDADDRIYIADRVRGVIDVIALDWNREQAPIIDMFMSRLARSMRLERLAPLGAAAGRSDWRTPDPADMLVGARAGGAGELVILDRSNLGVIFTSTRLAGGRFEPLPAEARLPSEMARAADGTLIVTDPVAGLLFLRQPNGQWLPFSGPAGTASPDGEKSASTDPMLFLRPSGVAVVEGATIVTDAALDGCIVLEEGRARRVGVRGVLDEQFYDPQSISDSPNGLIVIDRGNHRFQRFGAKDGDLFAWNMTGGLGRYYERKRRGSPGAPPRLDAPQATSGGAGANTEPSSR